MSQGLRAAALLGALAAGCARAPRPDAILLITLDTTRADRLGCYGYKGGTTPNLDAFAAESVRFEEAQSPVPVTLPSHASMFTGRYPAAHGVRYNGMFKLGDGAVTVAELLKEASWRTGAVPAAYPVAAKTGIGQGFETYDDMFEEPGAKKLPPNAERKAEEVTRRGIAWIEACPPGRKFFLWLHYYDPHLDYDPPFPFSVRFRDHPYEGEIAYMDREVGKVFEALKKKSLYDKMLILVAGDHGEGLYDHGEKMHQNLVYQSTLRVPLLVKPPGRPRPRVVGEPVSLVDVGPTILDYAGLPLPADTDGISLRPAIEGGSLPRRELYFEALAGALVFGWSPLEGVRRGKWKFIRSVSPELYDLEADPAEANNLFETDRDLASDLEASLRAMLGRFEKNEGQAESVAAPLDREEMERLASLGYIGGTVTEARRGGPNPKDLVHLEGTVSLGRGLMGSRSYEEALRVWQIVLAEDPGNRYALHAAAVAASRLGRLDLAQQYTEELTRRYPEYLPAWVGLGELRVAKRDFKGAVEVFREGLRHHPEAPALSYRLGLALLASGDPGEAVRVIEAAIAKGPKEEELPSFLVVRALCRARLGDPAGARQALQDAIAKGYRDREVLEKEPLLAPLRAVPGFKNIVEAIPKA